MKNHCIDTPISWLRLEQYVLEELPRETHAEVARHLATCEGCRACLQQIQADQALELPALPALPGLPALPEQHVPPGVLLAFRKRLPRAGTSGGPRRWAAAAVALAALALLVLPFGPGGSSAPGALPAARVRIKGGDVSIGLVRERGGSIAHEVTAFTTTDRFKVVASCPVGSVTHWDVVVFQAGEASFPFERGTTDCGNGIVLPGAFRLTAALPAVVCLVLASGELPVRAELARKGMEEPEALTACQRLEPVDD